MTTDTYPRSVVACESETAAQLLVAPAAECSQLQTAHLHFHRYTLIRFANISCMAAYLEKDMGDDQYEAHEFNSRFEGARFGTCIEEPHG